MIPPPPPSLPPSSTNSKLEIFCLQSTALSTYFKLHLWPSSLNNSIIPRDSWEIKRVMLGSTSVIPLLDPYTGDDDTCCFHAFQLLVCSEGLCFRLWLNEWLHHCVCWTNYCVWVSERKKEREMGDNPWVCDWCGVCAVLQQREGGGGGREDVNVWMSVNGIDFMLCL